MARDSEAAYHAANHAYAQQQGVTVSSVSVGGTNLITLTSSENAPDVSMLRLWLNSDSGAVFKSFKTEIGWTGQKTPQGAVVFTTAVPLKPGGSVKFGVETDAAVSGINWKAVGPDGAEVATGRVIPGEMPEIDDAQPRAAQEILGLAYRHRRPYSHRRHSRRPYSHRRHRASPRNPTLG